MRRSRLFYKLMALVDKLPRLELIVLENVRHILNKKMNMVFKSVMKELLQRGFQPKWTTIPASMLNAPHQRYRWYCVATKNNSNVARELKVSPVIHDEIKKLRNDSWNKDAQVPLHERLLREHDDFTMARLDMMGNAVVPICAHIAVRSLLTT